MTDQSTTSDATTPASGAPAKTRGQRRVLRGVVTSSKMDKTITVMTERRVRHPVYEKFVGKRTKVHAHDENNTAAAGDLVEICETRPLSKLKRWRLLRVVRQAQK